MVRVLSQLYRPFYRRYDASTQTIDAGVSLVLGSFMGPGTASVVIHGDGDPAFQVQIIYDDAITTLSPAEARLVTVTFNNILRIAIHNPGTAAVTSTTPTIEVNGIVKE